MKSKVEKELNKKNKILDFKGLFKNFVAGSQEDKSEEEVISNDASLTEQEKKELLASIKNTENLAHSLFAENIKKAARKTNTNTPRSNVNTKIKQNTYIRKENEQGDRADY